MLCMAVTDTDIDNCFDVINELRPQLVKHQFVQTVRSMEKQGFKLAFLHLDSGTHRGRAHKFYFDQGFTIASYHFSEALR